MRASHWRGRGGCWIVCGRGCCVGDCLVRVFGFCLCCSVSASASVVVGYGESGFFARAALLGDAMRAGGELEVGD